MHLTADCTVSFVGGRGREHSVRVVAAARTRFCVATPRLMVYSVWFTQSGLRGLPATLLSGFLLRSLPLEHLAPRLRRVQCATRAEVANGAVNQLGRDVVGEDARADDVEVEPLATRHHALQVFARV